MAEKGAETEEGRRGRGGPFVVADDLTVGGYDGRLTAAFFVALAAAHPWTHPHPLPRKGWRLRCSLLYTHATQQPYFASVLGRGGDRAAGPAARTLERRKKKKKKALSGEQSPRNGPQNSRAARTLRGADTECLR